MKKVLAAALTAAMCMTLAAPAMADVQIPRSDRSLTGVPRIRIPSTEPSRHMKAGS